MRSLLRRLFHKAGGGVVSPPVVQPGDVPLLLADGRVWTVNREGDWVERDLHDPANALLGYLNEGVRYRAAGPCTCIGKRQGDRHSEGCPIGPRSTVK